MNSSKILNELLWATLDIICWYQYGVQVPGLASELRENISLYGRSEELSAETHWCKCVMRARLIMCKDLAYKDGLSLNREKMAVSSTLCEGRRGLVKTIPNE